MIAKNVTIHTGNEGRNGAIQITISNVGRELATDEQPVYVRFWLKPLHMNAEKIEFQFHAGVAAALAENFIAYRVTSEGRIEVATDDQYRAEIWA